MRDCPQCGAVVDGLVCGRCHYAEPGAFDERKALARELPGPSSFDLTDEQWYAVCKFWPKVAARCKRPMVQVSPSHSLDALVSKGPLFGGGLRNE